MAKAQARHHLSAQERAATAACEVAGGSRGPHEIHTQDLPRRHPASTKRAPALRGTTVRRAPRVALYSHDTMGLGHMRRNLSIACSLAGSPLEAQVLMIAGANVATAFAMPAGVDCLTLPALYKNADGRYHSRSLDLSLNELIALRSNAIRGALEVFRPDVLIVDNVPHGVHGELDPVLQHLHEQRRTRCVLGLRDVLDEPEVVRREWAERGNEVCIDQHFDAVWIYGDQKLYDPVNEYGFSQTVASKVRYTGYFNSRCRSAPAAMGRVKLPPGKTALCMAGGGQDGELLARSFAGAKLPPDMHGAIVTGPFMPRNVQKMLRARASANPRLRVLEFHAEPAALLRRACRVVSMGGYNTVSEILSHRKRALVVPRVSPRREQMIRARRLSRLGLLDYMLPEMLTPDSLSGWLSKEIPRPEPVRTLLDFDGLRRLPALLGELLGEDRADGLPYRAAG